MVDGALTSRLALLLGKAYPVVAYSDAADRRIQNGTRRRNVIAKLPES